MTVTIPDSSDIRKIAAAVRQLRGVSKVKVQKDMAFMRIPGLPYTDEERRESLRNAEEDIRAGRVVTIEELRTRHPRI